MGNNSEATSSTVPSNKVEGVPDSSAPEKAAATGDRKSRDAPVGFTTMDKMQKEEPELYRMLMEGLFVSFMNQQKRAYERMKETRRQFEREG